ncbi:MAG: hypothetical protein HQM16_08630 [Deltaproteobacteria bacterium]|nr:hypothetical protein [Deltaproteobacteria bacterium]
MKNTCHLIIFFLSVLLYPSYGFSYPIQEKLVSTDALPLEILSTQPDFLYVPPFGDYQDKYMFSAYGADLTIIDLETWAAYQTQPDSFSTTIADVVMLANGTSLVVALTDGNLARIELDDEDTFANTITTSSDSTAASLVSLVRYQSDSTVADDAEEEEEVVEEVDSRQIDISADMTSPGISFIAADPASEIVYMVNSSGYYFEYNLNSNNLTELELIDESSDDGDAEESTEVVYSPNDMVLADSDGGDKVLITTTTGEVIVIAAGSGSYTAYQLSSSAVDNLETNLSQMAVTPDGNYVYIVDSDNDAIWVFSAQSNSFVDQYSAGTNPDPVAAEADNNTYTNVFVYEDKAGNVVTYAAGATGLSVISAAEPGTAAAQSKIIDGDESTPDTDDPITMSGLPGPIAATSGDAGYVFTANGDASISVLTDNPWITISSLEPTSVTAVSSTFTVVFQTDTPGSYTVRANSNALGTTGTELVAAATVAADATNTDIATSNIDINTFSRSTFIEGYNKIFILLTDAEGNIGHTAELLHVDRPPEPVTINSANFGNKKIYMSFNTSPDEDVASYTMYAASAESASSPVCPGSLAFDTNVTSGSLTAAACPGATCDGGIMGLVNDTPYCLALRVVDAGGQASTLSTYGTAITPEQTVGPAGFLGETSCALNPVNTHVKKWPAFFVFSLMVVFLFVFRMGRAFFFGRCLFFFMGMMVLIGYPVGIDAAERTPQNWTFEAKAGMMIPTDPQVKGFLGLCCNMGGEFEFGWLYKNRYNVTVSLGGAYDTGTAVGIRSGGASGDKFRLLMIPLRLDFVYRLDFKSEQLILPYVRAGVDTVFFRETTAGESIMNFKYGLHGGAGVGILLDKIEQLGHDLETEMGVNDIYLTLEGRYAMISSFKSTGLDLSGFYPYLGLLFEF